MGTLLFILLVILVLAVLLGAGGYSVRRYWSPAGSEVVETSETGSGAGAGIAAAILALLVLILLFFGFTQWNWFGTRSGGAGDHQQPDRDFADAQRQWRRQRVAERAGVSVLTGLPDPPQGSCKGQVLRGPALSFRRVTVERRRCPIEEEFPARR